MTSTTPTPTPCATIRRSLRALITVSALALIGGCESYGADSQTFDSPAARTNQTSEASARQTTSYSFASIEEASNILAAADEYTAQLQPTEIGVKNRDPEKTSFADLQENYRQGIVAWSDDERAVLDVIVNELRPALKPFERHLPSRVLMTKISNAIEGGLPHTRSNLIAFSESSMEAYRRTFKSDPEKAHGDLKELFLHELHHVLSRHNRHRHDAYYALIGFKPCDFTAPQSLRDQRLSNPDAPTYKHYAPVALEEGNGVIPYLTVSGPYSPETKGTLANYFSFGLLAITAENGTCTIAGDAPQLLSPGQVPDFFQLIGRNTRYIIHPEETLADNFIYLILQREGLPNPEIPVKIGAFWQQAQ